MTFDKDDLLIRNAFSQIEVDSKNLERKIEENIDVREVIKITPRRRRSFVALVTAACVLLVTGTVFAATTLGVFDRFIQELDPPFGDIVAPVEIYVIDQGIRIDVIAAQSFENNAIVYLSVRDVSGQNRITENVWLISHMSEETRVGWMAFTSIAGVSELMYFDDETQTAYLEIRIQDSMPIPDTMHIVITELFLGTTSKEIDFPVALSDMEIAPLMLNPIHPDWLQEYILIPSRGESFPEIPGDGWISNVSIMDEQLRVQLMSPNRPTYGMNSIFNSGIFLIDANGDMVDPLSFTSIGVNADLEAASNSQLQDLTIEEFDIWVESISYNIMEVTFPIDTSALNSYSLTLRGGIRTSVYGNWSTFAYTGGSNNNIKIMSEPARIGNVLLDSLFVSPLGVRFTGHPDGGVFAGIILLSANSIWVETPHGNILVEESPRMLPATSLSEDDSPDSLIIDGFARSESPIDVSAVTAVIFGDVRIPVE